jgi:hypothetical protein
MQQNPLFDQKKTVRNGVFMPEKHRQVRDSFLGAQE